jgi:hypothetical protein
MAIYVLGSWNASLILDPTHSIKKKISVLIIQEKLLEWTSIIISVIDIPRTTGLSFHGKLNMSSFKLPSRKVGTCPEMD